MSSHWESIATFTTPFARPDYGNVLGKLTPVRLLSPCAGKWMLALNIICLETAHRTGVRFLSEPLVWSDDGSVRCEVERPPYRLPNASDGTWIDIVLKRLQWSLAYGSCSGQGVWIRLSNPSRYRWQSDQLQFICDVPFSSKSMLMSFSRNDTGKVKIEMVIENHKGWMHFVGTVEIRFCSNLFYPDETTTFCPVVSH